MSEKNKIEETEVLEDSDYNEDENWQYVKVFDPSIVDKKRYMESKINRFYHRGEDERVRITYKEKPSRYSEGMY